MEINAKNGDKQIEDRILERMQDGELHTIRGLAKDIGCSYMTASKYLYALSKVGSITEKTYGRTKLYKRL